MSQFFAGLIPYSLITGVHAICKLQLLNYIISHSGSDATNGAQGHKLFPANYGTCFEFVKFASKAMLVILGLGTSLI